MNDTTRDNLSLYEALKNARTDPSFSARNRKPLSKQLIDEYKDALLAEHSSHVKFTDIHSAVAPGTVTHWSPIYCAGKSEMIRAEFVTVPHPTYGHVVAAKPEVYDRELKRFAVEQIHHHFLLNGRSGNTYVPYPHLKHQCSCEPGPHIRAGDSPAKIIGMGGGRGSAKTENVIKAILRSDKNGNPLINNSEYKALILRRNYDDMMEIMDRLYRVLIKIDPGAKLNKQDGFVLLSSGSQIFFDHMSTPDSLFQFHGKEFWTIFVDEAQLLPTEKHLMVLLLSNRTKYEDTVECKFYCTFNPGGVGATMIRNYFVEPKVFNPATGKVQRIRLTDRENWGKILIDEIADEDGKKTKVTKEFIFSTVFDNPYLAGDYTTFLKTIQDPVLKAQMLHGDFFAAEGTYFRNFRLKPFPGEPDNARHVHPATSLPLEPWNMRFGAMDWGHEHYTATAKAANNNGRMVVYDEKVGRGIEAREWGRLVAEWWKPELTLGHQVMIFLSHDAFKDIEYSVHKLLQQGADEVLGNDSTAVFDMQVTVKNHQEFIEKFREQCSRARLVFVNSGAKSRVFGWEVLRNMMLWESRSSLGFLPPYDEKLAQSLFAAGKLMEYQAYLAAHSEQNKQPLPRLVISDKCEKIIEAIPTAVYDTEGRNPEDVKKTSEIHDDVLDMLRYLALGFEHTGLVLKPLQAHMDEYKKALLSKVNSGALPETAVWQLLEKEEGRYGAVLENGEKHDDPLTRYLREGRLIGGVESNENPYSIFAGWLN